MTSADIARGVVQGPALSAARRELSSFERRPPEPLSAEMRQELAAIKLQAVAAGDQTLATGVWCLETIADIQGHYLDAFAAMKAQKYYDAWNLLERAEISAHFLEPHFDDYTGLFRVDYITEHAERFQGLFPYALFSSPEILKEEIRCSICDARITARSGCDHKPGEIYDGVMCARRIGKLRLLAIAIVPNPAHKYTVLFVNRRDQFDYSSVRFVVERLESPWHAWTYEWTKTRHPHWRFPHVGRNDPCPCQSGKKYKRCCLEESGVLRPHCRVSFSVPPPTDVSMFEYSAT